MRDEHRPVSRPTFSWLLMPLCWLLGGGAAAGGAPPITAAPAGAPATAAAPAASAGAPAAAAPADVTRIDLSFASEGRRREWSFGGDEYDVGFDPRESRAAGGQSLRLALRPGAVDVSAKAFGVASTLLLHVMPSVQAAAKLSSSLTNFRKDRDRAARAKSSACARAA
jgi:hypothetical protein